MLPTCFARTVLWAILLLVVEGFPFVLGQPRDCSKQSGDQGVGCQLEDPQTLVEDDNSQNSYLPSGESTNQIQIGSVAFAVVFIALFNFGMCCCCWCCCRVLDTVNHPLNRRRRAQHRRPVHPPPPDFAGNPMQSPTQSFEMQSFPPEAPYQPKALMNVVIVNPSGTVEIGVPQD